MEPDTSPISQEQQIRRGEDVRRRVRRWQAFIALHRTLFHEHHDFFSASQHPMLNGIGMSYGLALEWPRSKCTEMDNEQRQTVRSPEWTLMRQDGKLTYPWKRGMIVDGVVGVS